MEKRKQITKISKAGETITNAIETLTYSSALFISLLTIEVSAIDLAADGNLNILQNHPKGYTLALLSPVAIGALIKTFDPNSETGQDINKMIDDFKPKTKVRKK